MALVSSVSLVHLPSLRPRGFNCRRRRGANPSPSQSTSSRQHIPMLSLFALPRLRLPDLNIDLRRWHARRSSSFLCASSSSLLTTLSPCTSLSSSRVLGSRSLAGFFIGSWARSLAVFLSIHHLSTDQSQCLRSPRYRSSCRAVLPAVPLFSSFNCSFVSVVANEPSTAISSTRAPSSLLL